MVWKSENNMLHVPNISNKYQQIGLEYAYGWFFHYHME